METTEIDTIISNYVGNNFSPTDEERELISDRYSQLSAILSGVDIFQSGSYARFTAVTPVNDLDVIWVIPAQELKYLLGESDIQKVIDASDLDVTNILNDLASKLSSEYKKLGEEVRIEKQSHSVGIYFGTDDEFSIDVVPAIELAQKSDGYNVHLYKVPNILKYSHSKRRKIYASEEQVSWIKSDPRGYKAQATELDEKTDGVFRKTAKFMKKWRQSCKKNNSNFKLKGFHLEMIITNYFKENPQSGISETLAWVFRELPTFLVSPQIADRADSSKYIDDYLEDLTEQQRQIIRAAKDSAIVSVQKFSQAQSRSDVITVSEELTGGTQSTRIPAAPSYTVSPTNISKPWMGE